MIISRLSPFIDRLITCPACGGASPQPHFRLRLFVPGAKDTDGHIVEYKWMAENTQPVHPPYYFLSKCPFCHFTDVQEDFDNPAGNRLGSWVTKSFKAATPEQRSMIEFLARHVRYPEIDFQSAVNLHLLAIYIQLQQPGDTLDWRKAGRLTLRLAWLFRENGSAAPAVLDSTEQEQGPDELQAALDAFDAQFGKMKAEWMAFRRALALRAVQHRAEARQQAPSAVPKTDVVAAATHQGVITKLLEQQEAELGRLKAAVTPPRIVVVPGQDTPEVEGGYFSFGAYEDYLVQLKQLWPQAPLTEIDAMRGAVTYFKEAISSDPAFDSHHAYSSAIKLVIELMIRCDDLDGAFEMVRGIYKSAADARVHCQQELQNKQLDTEKRERLTNQLRRFNDSIQNAGELREKLLDCLVKRDWPKIERILEGVRGASTQDVTKALRDGGVVPGVITHLTETGMLAKYAK